MQALLCAWQNQPNDACAIALMEVSPKATLRDDSVGQRPRRPAPSQLSHVNACVSRCAAFSSYLNKPHILDSYHGA